MRKIYFVLLFALPLMSCSVRHNAVENNPPVFSDRMVQLSNSEFGRFQPKTFSAFLWPEALKDQALENAMAQVLLISASIDQIQLSYVEKQKKIDAVKGCVAKYADTEEDELGNSSVKAWHAAATPEETAALKECQDLYAGKEKLEADIQKDQSENIPKMQDDLDQIAKIVDPVPGQVKNYVSVDAPNSKVQILNRDGAIQVMVQIAGFPEAKNLQSTVLAQNSVVGGQIYDATYNPQRKELKFKMPQIIGGQLTGGLYEFTYSRWDFAGNPRFTGDVKLTLDGQERYGSSQIDAVQLADTDQ
jgi:hypothetical protein